MFGLGSIISGIGSVLSVVATRLMPAIEILMGLAIETYGQPMTRFGEIVVSDPQFYSKPGRLSEFGNVLRTDRIWRCVASSIRFSVSVASRSFRLHSSARSRPASRRSSTRCLKKIVLMSLSVNRCSIMRFPMRTSKRSWRSGRARSAPNITSSRRSRLASRRWAKFAFSANNKSKVHIIATHWDVLNDPDAD